MGKIEIIAIKNSPIDSNCYLIIDSHSNSSVIIDPGSQDSSVLLSVIESHDVKPEYVILTHEHFDHIWGVNILKDTYRSVIMCSKECSERIIDGKKNLSVFYNQTGFKTYEADIQFDSSIHKMTWGENTIELIKTKGHSLGSICIKIGNSLFTGDTVIRDSKTVVKLPESSRSDLKQSLAYLESVCNLNTHIYPGHGESFTFTNESLQNCL